MENLWGVKYFQNKYGLTPDGIIGKKTLNKIKEVFKIATPEQLANFMGQCSHESKNFTAKRESMNYSVDGLINTFSYYKNNQSEARKDGRTSNKPADQETIANKVYWDKNRASGYKLGNPNWGDGWKYRGCSAIQLTGGENIKGFARWIGDNSIIDNPDVIWEKYYIESAIYYFEKNKLWNMSKEVNTTTTSKLTKAIQGGTLHTKERYDSTKFYYNLLK